MRKIIFWLHLTAGLTAGLVVVIMSLTGTLLMYEKQIAAWADGYRVEPPAGQPTISIQALLQSAASARPEGVPTSVTLNADPTRPASVSLGREGTLFLNPFTATVFGAGATEVRAFFRSVTDWHRWLALPTEDRATGRAVTGAANLLFLFIVVSGLYIWWPRSWTPASVRSVVLFRRGLQGKARDFNWHNVIGFWSVVPLFFVVSTATVISYPWAGDLLYRATGSEPPPRPSPNPTPQPAGRREPRSDASPAAPRRQALDVEGLDALFLVATRHTPDWRTLTFRIAGSPKEPVSVSIDTSPGAARPDMRSTLVLDRVSGNVIRHETYEAQVRGRQLRTWARWIHTGEAFGLPGQTIAGLASFGALFLAWTGFALSWRRFRSYRTRTAKARGAIPAELPPDVVASR